MRELLQKDQIGIGLGMAGFNISLLAVRVQKISCPEERCPLEGSNALEWLLVVLKTFVGIDPN